MRVAILHPWLLETGGAERVVDVLAEMYPEADIFTLFMHPSKLSKSLMKRHVVTSFLNHLPFCRLYHRKLMAFYPWAVESLDLSTYDLVISSCGAAMMGAVIAENCKLVCYVHTPERTWWDLYPAHLATLSPITKLLFVAGATSNRVFETLALQRADVVIANSHFIQRRLSKYLNCRSEVIYPPVETHTGYLAIDHDDYYLYVGRLEHQKRIDILINACNEASRKLVIVGSGSADLSLKAIAGPNVTFLGRVPDSVIGGVFARCRAFLFAALEDFGISPVEAQSYGRPVIAYARGGSLETVRVDDPSGRSDTGVFFMDQTVASVVNAIRHFETIEKNFHPGEIQQHAREYDVSTFVEKFRSLISQVVARE